MTERTDDFAHRQTQANLAAVEREYSPLHNDLDAELRAVLQPLNDARGTMLKRQVTLQTIAEEHRAGRIANDQVPKLRAAVIDDMDKAQAVADKAVRARLKALPGELAARAFATPPRGAETSEAKADLRMRMDNSEDVFAAMTEAANDAARRGDALALRLLASDWGRDYAASRSDPEYGAAVVADVRRIATASADLFPTEARSDLAKLERIGDLEKAHAMGINLVDMTRAAAVDGRA